MKTLTIIALAAIFLLPGCASVRKKVGAKIAGVPLEKTLPLPHAANFYLPSLPDKSLPMRRVAMLPLAGGRYSTEALRNVTAAFQGELNRKTIFEVVQVSGADLEAICGQRTLSSVEHIPSEVLHALHERFGAEGVLFTDITNFSPYRPLAIGVRAKLVDTGSAAISWACDVVFDSGQPAVAEAARKFQQQFSDPHRKLADDGGSVLLSPARFAKFVANEAFSSLDTSSSVMH